MKIRFLFTDHTLDVPPHRVIAWEAIRETCPGWKSGHPKGGKGCAPGIVIRGQKHAACTAFPVQVGNQALQHDETWRVAGRAGEDEDGELAFGEGFSELFDVAQ